MCSTGPIKIIELEDEQNTKQTEFPYILSSKRKIRFRLRSKMCFQLQPLILLEKLESFEYLLPLKEHIDINDEYTRDNFVKV